MTAEQISSRSWLRPHSIPEAGAAEACTDWRRQMVEQFTQIDSELLAVLSNGELLSAPLTSLEWRRVLPDVKDVNAVTAMM